MSDHLKPCAFCGSYDVHARGDNASWMVECDNCDASGSVALSMEQACDFWNNRRTQDILDALVHPVGHLVYLRKWTGAIQGFSIEMTEFGRQMLLDDGCALYAIPLEQTSD